MVFGRASRSAATLVALGCMLAAGGLLFTQPAPGQHASRPRVSQGMEQQVSFAQAYKAESTAEEGGLLSGVFRSLCFGVALGLAVGLSGASSAEAFSFVKSANADKAESIDYSPLKFSDLSPEEVKKMTKANFNSSTKRTFTKADYAKPYNRATTDGSNGFKEVQLDLASPITPILNANGTALPNQVVDYDKPPKALLDFYAEKDKAIAPLKKTWLRTNSKYGNFFQNNPMAPFKVRGGAAYEGPEGRQNTIDGIPR